MTIRSEIIHTHIRMWGIKVQDGLFKIQGTLVNQEFLDMCKNEGLPMMKRGVWYYLITKLEP